MDLLVVFQLVRLDAFMRGPIAAPAFVLASGSRRTPLRSLRR